MQSTTRHPVRNLILLTLAGTAAGCAATSRSESGAAKPMAAPAQVAPVELVDALNGVFGKHMARGSHAKGFCFAGQLEAAPGGATLTRAAMFQPGKRTSVTGRFSIGGGNPKAPDNARSVRGIAVRADDGKEQLDWVFVSAPHFFAQTPDAVRRVLQGARARSGHGQDQPRGDRRVLQGQSGDDEAGGLHRRAAGAGQLCHGALLEHQRVHRRPVPRARRSRSAGASSRWPAASGLTDDEAKAKGAEFLRAELAERLAKGPVAFNVMAQLARPAISSPIPPSPGRGSHRGQRRPPEHRAHHRPGVRSRDFPADDAAGRAGAQCRSGAGCARRRLWRLARTAPGELTTAAAPRRR